ncbi:MAG TPA: permease, partial [Thermoanaerobaculia bacterium]|nr:permease [Thermoanaerobaculia bacterium]
MGTTLRDLLYAIRRLAKSPGQTLTLVAILTLSIGSTLAIFSLVHSVLVAPLPFPEPGRLVEVYNLHDGERWSVSPLDLRDL